MAGLMTAQAGTCDEEAALDETGGLAVVCHPRVRGEQRQAFYAGLGDQQAVEGVEQQDHGSPTRNWASISS